MEWTPVERPAYDMVSTGDILLSMIRKGPSHMDSCQVKLLSVDAFQACTQSHTHPEDFYSSDDDR